jgi:hypothetical protein
MQVLPMKLETYALDLVGLKGVFDLYLTAYPSNKSLAMFLTPHGSLDMVQMVTKNLQRTAEPTDNRCCFVQTYDNCEGLLEKILDSEVAVLTQRMVAVGFTGYPEVRIQLPEPAWAKFDEVLGRLP